MRTDSCSHTPAKIFSLNRVCGSYFRCRRMSSAKGLFYHYSRLQKGLALTRKETKGKRQHLLAIGNFGGGDV